jgi:hypothetical protein
MQPIISDSPATSTQPNIADVLDERYPKHKPVVRYAICGDNGIPEQEPILRGIYDKIPEDADWVSSMYFISNKQESRLREHLDDPYANPSSDNIAQTIQNECEHQGRVLYSIHAESDEYENSEQATATLSTMVGWLQDFAKAILNLNPDDCKFYFSGNRSIHLHAPLFVTGENIPWLKEQAKEFCENTDAVLDTTVYKRKQQFRIPGVVHADNGGVFQKAQIQPSWNHSDIIRASTSDVEMPENFAEILETVYNVDSNSNLSDLLLSSTTDQSNSSSPLSDWPSRYQHPYDSDPYLARNAKEFYPYPTGDSHSGRSVAAIRVEGEPFERHKAGKLRTFVPCYFIGAHSCSGREYTKDGHYAPLQLSKPDAEKWDYAEGDTVVIIGGGSHQSIISSIDASIAEKVGELLDPDEGKRQDALEYLEERGIETGSTGSTAKSGSNGSTFGSKQGGEIDTGGSGTDASRLQKRAEQRDVEKSLTHKERGKVANRLLVLSGWDYAWEWFREQYAEDFDKKETWRGLKSIVDTYSEDFQDIDVPPKP